MKQLLWLWMLVSAGVYGQKLELGKVSVAELQEKAYLQDTTAAAAITFTKGKTRFVYDNKKGF